MALIGRCAPADSTHECLDTTERRHPVIPPGKQYFAQDWPTFCLPKVEDSHNEARQISDSGHCSSSRDSPVGNEHEVQNNKDTRSGHSRGAPLSR